MTLGLKQIWFWFDKIIAVEEYSKALTSEGFSLSIATCFGDKEANKLRKEILDKATQKLAK